MKSIKYFIQFIIICLFFLIFKILGLRISSILSSKIMSYIGPFFRSKKIIETNILKALPHLSKNEIKKISNQMWGNYGRILSDYMQRFLIISNGIRCMHLSISFEYVFEIIETKGHATKCGAYPTSFHGQGSR